MATDSEPLDIVNNEARHRFEARVGEQLAVLEYTLATGLIVYNHTEVPKTLEGQGIAGQLAKTALEFAQANELKIMPLCPYVATYIRRHPEYKALLRPGFNV
ncbi:MAG: GNAT family N-acetyltransferase [Tunicatimonas sp.]